MTDVNDLITEGLGAGGSIAALITEGLSSAPAPPPTSPTAPPTEAEIADALSGRFGPVVSRLRFEWRDHDYVLLGDLTPAVEVGGYVEMDNTRSVPVTGRITVLTDNLPDGFSVDDDHIAVVYELLVNGEFEPFPIAFMHSDIALTVSRPDGQGGTNEVATLEMSDLSVHLEGTTPDAHVIAAGTNYITAAEAILDGLHVTHNLPGTTHTLPVPMTFGPATPWRTIIDQLMLGINFFPVWPDGTGTFITRARVRPPDETATVEYDTTEPRMIIGDGVEEELARTRFDNRAVVVIDHPDRTATFELRENKDGSSRISTLNAPSSLKSIDGQFVVDTTIAGEVAEYHLLDQIARSSLLRLRTLMDPRRGVHDYYAINIDGAITGLYQLLSWRMPLEVGPMEHLLGAATDATITEP